MSGRVGSARIISQTALISRETFYDARRIAIVLHLTLLIGQYALRWHLDVGRQSLTDIVRAWRSFGSKTLPLPHPSPRNNLWLRRNPWFEAEVLPILRRRVRRSLR